MAGVRRWHQQRRKKRLLQFAWKTTRFGSCRRQRKAGKKGVFIKPKSKEFIRNRLCHWEVVSFAVMAICGLLCPGLARAQAPAALTDLGTVAPNPGKYDVSQLSAAGEANMPDGLNYYTDNQSNHGAGEPGQTFTTGTNALTYTLNTLAIRTGGGSSSGTTTPQSYLLHIYSVSNGTAAVIATYIATNVTFNDGDWLRWSGLAVTFSPASVYGYSFGKASGATSGWDGMGNSGGNPYAGGELGLLPVAGGAVTFGASHNYDAIFDIGLTSNGPSAAVITNNPPTVIQSTSATLAGTVLSTGGSAPVVRIFYGPADGGTNANAWANSVALGAESGGFSTTVTGLSASKTYFFAAQASNVYGISWAQPSENFTTLADTNPAPAVLTDLGAAAPTPGLNDVSQFSTTGDSDTPDNLNYYTDNQPGHNAGEPGQTFTTPENSSGFLLASVALKTGGGTSSGTTTPQGYLLHIYSVSNGTASVLATFSATNFAFSDGDWLQWSGLNVSLSAGAVYGYSFGKISSAVGGWEAMANASGSPYAGGELALMPVAGGSITFGASHSYDAVFDIGLTSTGPPTVARIANSPATAIQASSAALNGQVVASGGSLPLISFFYGTVDGGTNAAAWSNRITVGSELGSFTATVTGLQSNSTYYYTAEASNAAGVSWAVPSASFTTPATVSVPAVTNLPATFVSGATATLNGQVLNTGNEWPLISVYYGTNDGGTNAVAWSNAVSLPAQSGPFSAQIVGLIQGVKYYFTVSASNSAGVSWAQPSLSFTTLTVTRVPVLTYHYDNTRQGWNSNETALSPANVNTASFGKLFTYAVDGYVYAQPLIVTNLTIPGRGVRDVVFVATEHDSIFAFDANSNGDASGGLLWKTNVGISAVSPSTEYGLRYHGVGNLDMVPEEGMTGAPVIDLATGTLFVDAFTREVVAGISTNYYHRIHALNITNGMEQPYSPVVVAATVPGTGVSGNGTGSPETENGTNVTFSAIQECQRPALTLAGGVLYVCYGSHDDTDPYHGWVFGYNSTNLAMLSVFNTTPNATLAAFGGNAGEGAIWMSGNGLCVDANTNLYFLTGNGSFSQNTNGGDYSDSFVKLSTASNKLTVADYFTPYNQASLQASDSDLGSGGVMLLPDSAGSTSHPHLIVGCGKDGNIRLVDRDNMGHYNAANDNQAVQELPGAVGGTWSSPAYFNHLIFYEGSGDVMKAFYITNGVISSTPISQSSTSIGFPGATPTISSSGTNNGIAWVIDDGAYLSSGPAVLHAYNATNLAIELYNSSQDLPRDNPGPAVKMVPPVVAGGKVYVGAQYALSVFGSAVFMAAPTISPASGPFTNSITVTLADANGGASIYYTLDGTAPSTSSILYTGPFLLTNSAIVQAIAAAPGAVNSAAVSASFLNSAASGAGIGLTGSYFANSTSANPFAGSPVLTQTNATINFNWGMNGPSPVVGGTNFTVRWTGSIQPQFSEAYTLYLTANAGARLYINGQLFINGWQNQTNAATLSNSIPLVAQQLYGIELDYYQTTNDASVSLSWSSPSTPMAIVPETQLYPFTNPPPSVALIAPANASSYTAAASVSMSADADAPYNPISMVSFYANGSLIDSVTNPPYTVTVTGLAAGNYTLTAVAVDGSGLSSTTAPINIAVTAATGQPYGLTNRSPAPAFFNMPTTFAGPLPGLLSQTGVFGNTANMAPVGGLIPYLPNVPLWSDGALKTRYFAVPGGGGIGTPNQQISFAPTGTWSFPAGTVFVKTFQLNTDTSNPNVLHRLETRLLVRDINGAVYGVTYKWRPDNSDADLLTNSLTEQILITNSTGVAAQTWYYPSPADCLQCHTAPANYVLGVSTRQLNGNGTYPSTGVTDNQLRALNRLGLFNPAFDEASITNMEKLSALTNLGAPLVERARSYLDANCAQCHQPGGTGITFDARYDTPLASQNITNYPAAISLGYDNACIIKSQDIWRSMIYQRMNTTNAGVKMPPLARNLIDTNAVAVMAGWINSLPGIPALAPPVITPDGGAFFSTVSISLAAPDTNAAVYYTLNGSLPTTNSFLYAGPFVLASNATVLASAFEPDFNHSVSASALFVVEPVQISFGQFLTNGQFQLQVMGAPGSNYVLQATTNLLKWTSLSTNLLQSNLLYLVDPGATNHPLRFYRVLQQ